ncbi:MAG: ankyrin repeat domain-containing protein, partial [Burkholderiales bacterium]
MSRLRRDASVQAARVVVADARARPGIAHVAPRCLLGIALLVLAMQPLSGVAHETDQYTLPVGREFADLGGYFSGVVHDAIADAVKVTNAQIENSLWRGQPTEDTARLQSPDFIAGEVWQSLFFAITTNEGLDAKLNADVLRNRYPGLVAVYKPEQNIYDDPLLLIDLTKWVRTFFRSSTVDVGGTLFGTDKLLHFIHLGRIYHSAYLDAREEGLPVAAAEARTVEISAKGYNPFLSENGFLGLVSTGIRSNADLAADYAGLKFYRNLTEPVRIGKSVLPPMLVREGYYWRLADRVRLGSDFFAAFITPHFNEALNPNGYALLIGMRVRKMLKARCFDLLDWYRDGRGRVRSREQFAAVEQELSTFYGEAYGYENDGEDTVSIATTCFEADIAHSPGRMPPDADPRAAPAPTRVQSAWIKWPGSDRFGRTELWWAAREGRVEDVGRLIAQVENPNARDVDDEGPLHAGVRGGHAKVVEVLIAYGADVRAANRYGATPLHIAIDASQPEIARVLLTSGADVNARDMFGTMPLHQAALAGNRELAALLLEHGADATARYRRRTPAQLAELAGNATLATWLASYGAGPLAKRG